MDEFNTRNLRENDNLMSTVKQPEDSNSAIATEVLQREIREKIQEFGMDTVGFSSVKPPVTGSRYQSWLDAGMHAGMEYLQRHSEKKLTPDLILPGAKSMISVLVNYATDTEEDAQIAKSSSQQPSGPVIARYARHLDYHDTFGSRLKKLSEWIDQRFCELTAPRSGPSEVESNSGSESGSVSDPVCNFATDNQLSRSLWYVDTGPILEREFAWQGGLGFIGKHTGLISRRLGNWTFIGEIITKIPFVPAQNQEPNRCGSCSKCLDICPTDAFPQPFQLDARKCISYWTIENKGSIPESIRPLIGNHLFGCDACLEVCPWNKFAVESSWMKQYLWAESSISTEKILDWLRITPKEFKSVFVGTPIIRAKRKGFLRNLCVVLGNLKMVEARSELEKLALDTEPLIAEHAAWALEQMDSELKME